MKLSYKSVDRPATSPSSSPRTWGRTTKFPFGKYKGLSVLQVLVKDVRYVSWCLENVGGFALDDEARAAYEAFKAEA